MTIDALTIIIPAFLAGLIAGFVGARAWLHVRRQKVSAV